MPNTYEVADKLTDDEIRKVASTHAEGPISDHQRRLSWAHKHIRVVDTGVVRVPKPGEWFIYHYPSQDGPQVYRARMDETPTPATIVRLCLVDPKLPQRVITMLDDDRPLYTTPHCVKEEWPALPFGRAENGINKVGEVSTDGRTRIRVGTITARTGGRAVVLVSDKETDHGTGKVESSIIQLDKDTAAALVVLLKLAIKNG